MYEDAAKLASEGCSRKWQAASATARAELRMPADFKPWTSQPTHTGGVLNPRVADVIDIAFVKARKTTGSDLSDLVTGLVLDVSQPSTRASAVSTGSMPSFKPSTLLYSYEAGAFIHPEVGMLLHGWPREHITVGVKDTQELAATGTSLPLATIVSSGLYLNPHGSWWRSGA